MHRQREAATALIADQGGWIPEKPADRFRLSFRDPAAPDPSQATVFAFLSCEFFGELHPGTRISKADEDLSMLMIRSPMSWALVAITVMGCAPAVKDLKPTLAATDYGTIWFATAGTLVRSAEGSRRMRPTRTSSRPAASVARG